MKVPASLRPAACLFLALAAVCHPARAQKRGAGRNQTPDVRAPIVVVNADVLVKAEEEGFEAVFPGVPERRLIKGDPAVEKPDSVQYDLHTKGEFYSARSADYNFTVTDPAKLKVVYELVRQAYFDRARQEQGTPEAVLLGEKDVFLDGRPGKEWVISWNKRVIWLRSFWIQQRLYQLFYTTPAGRQSLAATIKQKEAKAAEFFDSFKVTKLPPPLNAPANHP
jgi:hypothetical protein